MEGGAKDARRRRIIERGSDRLAFITGEARTLPPSPPLPPKPQPTAASLSKDDATGFGFPKHQVSNQTASSTVEYDDGKELLPYCETSRELSGGEATDEFPKCKLGKEFPKRGRSNEAVTNAPTNDRSSELSTTSVDRGSSDQVVDTASRTAPQISSRIFTCSRISRSISETENIRIVCAITLALLVVISDHGYSLGGGVVRSLVKFRPLFLVLLTDATIVLGRLLLTKGSDEKDERRTTQEEKGLADNLGKALEVALVVQKALRDAFMDCSICAVIMISGLAV